MLFKALPKDPPKNFTYNNGRFFEVRINDFEPEVIKLDPQSQPEVKVSQVKLEEAPIPPEEDPRESE